jgi:hypothetical protein
MSSSAAPLLPVGAGYGKLCSILFTTSANKNAGVVVGIGFFFAFLMMGISWLQNRYTMYSTKQSEEFNTASRSVKPGLIASGIVSAWTWAATLLQSSTVRVSQLSSNCPIRLIGYRSHIRTESQGLSGTLPEQPYKS